VYVVAIAALAGPVEAEAAALAADLGVTPYELRLNLTAGLPAFVLMSSDRERAISVRDRIAARRHGTIFCDSDQVVASQAMVSMRRFRLEADAVLADDSAAETRLEYDDIHVLLRAVHRTTETEVEEVREKKFRPGAALLTGGVVLTKTRVREVQRTREEREEVLYIFRQSGATPWLLPESAQYQGLGKDLVPTRHGNFLTTIRLLRERSRFAKYDERLISRRKLPELSIASDTEGSTSGMDLVAHVLAQSIAGGAEPYRT
jgi:hypothetical protein